METYPQRELHPLSCALALFLPFESALQVVIKRQHLHDQLNQHLMGREDKAPRR